MIPFSSAGADAVWLEDAPFEDVTGAVGGSVGSAFARPVGSSVTDGFAEDEEMLGTGVLGFSAAGLRRAK